MSGIKTEALEGRLEAAIAPNPMWDFGNDVLYSLCRDNPGHNTKGVVTAKLWLIGRAYAAAVERRRGEAVLRFGSNDELYEKVVEDLMRCGIDERINYLWNHSRIDDKNLPAILELHAFLVARFRNFTDTNKRSLASKYLHFHLPDLFYIYDSRASMALKRIESSRKARMQLPGREFDSEYKAFFDKMLSLRDDVKQYFGKDLTPRQLDNLLLYEQ